MGSLLKLKCVYIKTVKHLNFLCEINKYKAVLFFEAEGISQGIVDVHQGPGMMVSTV